MTSNNKLFSSRYGLAKIVLLSGMLAAALPIPAKAGGYDTGEQDWDFLFQTERVNVESGGRYIIPRRKLKNIVGVFGPSFNTDETESFFIPRVSLTANLTDATACMLSYREPWGGHADYGSTWTYAASATGQHFSSRDYGATCKYQIPLETGNLHFIAGLSYQTVEYELTQSLGPGANLSTNVSDGGVGWRAGIAYDIPEYALRTSLIYNSEIDYTMTGIFNAFGLPIPITGELTMPRSVEWRMQSGIAQNWLAFGSIKWTDWSVMENMALCPVGTPLCAMPTAVSALTLMWKDTWTVTLGAAHRLNDAVSVLGSLTWDQGATQGFTSQTDTWVLNSALVVTPNERFQFRLGGGIGILTSGNLSTMLLPGGIPNPVGYTASFGNDYVFNLSANAKITF